MCTAYKTRAFVVLAALFWLPVLICISASGNRLNNWDEKEWHLPAVKQISDKWPAVDLREDCLSASPPGYHWLLGGFVRLTGGALPALRLGNAFFGFGVLMLLFCWLCQTMEPVSASWSCAPLALSNFLIKSSAWVLTDNAGLFFSLAALLLVIAPKPRVPAAAIVTAATVFVRHLQAWVMAPVACAVWWGGTKKLTGLIWLLLPLMVLALLFWSWGGLVPPHWREANVGLSTCPQAYLLTLSIGFLLLMTPGEYLHSEHWRNERVRLVAAGLCGLAFACLTPTAYDAESGRWGGYLWSLVQRMPVIAGRSSLFLLLAPFGAVLWMLLWLGMQRDGAGKAGWTWAMALVAWVFSLVVCRQVFQRYFEPLILVFIILALAFAPSGKHNSAGWRLRILLLCAFQAVLTTLTAIKPAF